MKPATYPGKGNPLFSLSHELLQKKDTLPETNSKSTWKWMVGIRLFPFGARPIFRGRLAVSFRGKISHIPQVDPWLKGKHTKKFIRKVSGKFYHRTERKPHPKEGEMILASYTWIFQICVSNLVPTFTPKNPTNLGRHFYISTRYTRWFSRRDLFVPDRWRVTVIAFQRVTFSPSQKGHKELLGGDHFISHEIRIPSWTKSIMECHKGFQIWWNMPKYIKYIIHILQILGQRFKASNI